MSSIVSNQNTYYNFYSIDNRSYTTKFKALVARSVNGQQKPIRWHLPNFEFELKKIDCELAPADTLENLYKQRALDIRNRYDWIILHYSGGADSHNILETFMLNGIHLDEICIHYYPSDENPTEPIYQLCDHLNEVPKIAIPMARYFISNYSPKTKLTVKTNIKDSIIDYWKNFDQKKAFDKSLDVWLMRDPVRMYRIQSYSNNPSEWYKLKEHKRVAHIFGLEKPTLFSDQHGIYCNIADSIINARQDGSRDYDDDILPYHVEYFFLHPKHLKLYLKAAHTLLENVDKFPQLLLDKKTIDNKFFETEDVSQDVISTYKLNNFKDSGREYQNLCANILYNQKYKLPFTEKKVGDFLFDGSFDTLPKFVQNIYFKTASLGLIGNSPYNIDYVLYSFIAGNETAFENFNLFLSNICYFFPGKTMFEVMRELRKNFEQKLYIKYHTR